MSKEVLDIVLDLEFFGTEEDMIRDYPCEDAFPIITSIGLAAQLEGKLLFSKNFPLNMQEQLENGAKFGNGCMLDFWTKQPLFGEEFHRSFAQDQSMELVLHSVASVINNVRTPDVKVNMIGNNLLADNNKLIRLFSKYSYCPLPWSYWENMDYREFINTVTILGFDRKGSEKLFEGDVFAGRYSTHGFTAPKLHNAEYDCLKQLYVLNDARSYLNYVKENI